MSTRNIFLIKLKEDTNINNLYNALNEFMLKNKFGIIFEPKNYQDEFLLKLNCKKNYFSLTENKNCVECEEIFENYDAFKYAITFPKKEFEERQKEFLYNKLGFIDELIKIIFKNNNVELVEVYISTQYSFLLEDYSNSITVNDKKFVDALIKSYNPTKKENCYGLKTTKFIINK